MLFSIRKGYDPALPGAPRQSVEDAASVGSAAILGADCPGLRPALAGLVLCSVLAVLGGGAIQALEWKRSEGTPRTSPAIEVSPSIAGYLRVVAEPWANVIVDGQKVDTTPFARSIVLAPGTHYVRLEHPNAPTERRTIHLVPGETVLLDVKMAVEHAPVPDAGIVDASEAEASP